MHCQHQAAICREETHQTSDPPSSLFSSLFTDSLPPRVLWYRVCCFVGFCLIVWFFVFLCFVRLLLLFLFICLFVLVLGLFGVLFCFVFWRGESNISRAKRRTNLLLAEFLSQTLAFTSRLVRLTWSSLHSGRFHFSSGRDGEIYFLLFSRMFYSFNFQIQGWVFLGGFFLFFFFWNRNRWEARQSVELCSLAG